MTTPAETKRLLAIIGTLLPSHPATVEQDGTITLTSAGIRLTAFKWPVGELTGDGPLASVMPLLAPPDTLPIVFNPTRVDQIVLALELALDLVDKK